MCSCKASTQLFREWKNLVTTFRGQRTPRTTYSLLTDHHKHENCLRKCQRYTNGYTLLTLILLLQQKCCKYTDEEDVVLSLPRQEKRRQDRRTPGLGARHRAVRVPPAPCTPRSHGRKPLSNYSRGQRANRRVGGRYRPSGFGPGGRHVPARPARPPASPTAIAPGPRCSGRSARPSEKIKG